MNIHPTAIISKKADIADDVEIGPYAIVEENVVIGPGCRLSGNTYICKGTTIGRDCKIHKGAVIGDEPQDLSYSGKETYLRIGGRNTFREYVTVHRGAKEGSETIIGNDCYFMAFVHIGHNCTIGDNVIIVNNSLLAGHVVIEDRVFISASCFLHQFVRIGKLAMMGGGILVRKDIPPFMLADRTGSIRYFNRVGLKRAGFDSQTIAAIKEAYRIIYRSGLNLTNALREIEEKLHNLEIEHLLEFIRSSKRGICLGRSTPNLAAEDSDA
jgi:UDP-N-acetylglucosamine acyltransferase